MSVLQWGPAIAACLSSTREGKALLGLIVSLFVWENCLCENDGWREEEEGNFPLGNLAEGNLALWEPNHHGPIPSKMNCVFLGITKSSEDNDSTSILIPDSSNRHNGLIQVERAHWSGAFSSPSAAQQRNRQKQNSKEDPTEDNAGFVGSTETLHKIMFIKHLAQSEP